MKIVKMVKKRILPLNVLLAVIFFVSAATAASGSGGSVPGIMVNNAVIDTGAPAAYLNGVIMAPAKELIEALGGTFAFDSKSMTATIQQGENELVYRLDDNAAKLNGKYIQAPEGLKIINFRFMAPVEFTCEKLGAQFYMKAAKNLLMIFQPSNGKLIYKVQWGDSLWIISRLFGTSVSSLKQINGLASDMIYAGQQLVIKDFAPFVTEIPAYTTNGATIRSGPGFGFSETGYLRAWTNIKVTGKVGGWYKTVTPKGSGYIYHTVIGMGQDIGFGSAQSAFFNGYIPVDASTDYVTYIEYTVKTGDHIWAISESYGIPNYELAQANGLSVESTLYPGQILKVPVHHIAVKETAGKAFGEILDWHKQGQYLFALGKTGKLTDLATGRSFMVKRTIGANHADTETLTVADTAAMKEIFGSSWNWERRPFILEVDGRKLAVSVSGMPHGGVDGVPFLHNVGGRSDNWGYGPNYDAIAGNGMDGHFDLYFLNSLRHADNAYDPAHQYNALAAGGLR